MSRTRAVEGRAGTNEAGDAGSAPSGASPAQHERAPGREGALEAPADIREPYATEEALRDSERRLSQIIDFLPDPTFAIDREGRIIAWNRALEELTGTRAEDMLDKGDHEYAIPLYGVRRPVLVDLLFEPNEEIEKSYRFIERQGDVLLIEADLTFQGVSGVYWCKAGPLYDSAGNMTGAIESIRDVTDRQLAERAIRESEERYRSLVELSPNAVVVHAGGRVRYINRAGVSLFGATSAAEIVDKPIMGFVVPAMASLIEERVRRIYDHHLPVGRIAEKLYRLDGQVIDAEVAATPVTYMGESASLVVISDITDRMRAEAALRESEERYRRITESITDYLYAVKVIDGVPAETVHGPGCVAVTGYAPEDFERDPDLWIRIVAPEDRGRVLDQARSVLALERPQPIEHRIVRADGKVRWVRRTPVPSRAPDGTLTGYDGLVQDVTEFRSLQEQFLQSQKMESVGRLAGGVAHDFNNLLTAILGNAELALLDLNDHQAATYIDEIAKAGERAASLTRQLLGFASKQMIAPVRLDLSAMVADSENMLRRLLSEDIEVVTVLDPRLGTIQADPSQIQQLLINLTANARDAMPAGGKLIVETSNEVVTEEYAAQHPETNPGQYVMLSVADTGIGMAEETLAHVFEPFFTTKSQGRGTGLGLATCHGIVKQNGGHIVVYSEIGKGTTFHILLPSVGGPADRPAGASPSVPLPGGTETVLVVEDESTVRRLAVLGLRAHGYRVLEAADGPAGLQIASAMHGAVDLVVSDVIMPGMSGTELVGRLRAMYADIPVILVSGHAEATVMPPGMPHTGAAFLQKPFTPERLARKVRGVLDARSPRTAT